MPITVTPKKDAGLANHSRLSKGTVFWSFQRPRVAEPILGLRDATPHGKASCLLPKAFWGRGQRERPDGSRDILLPT